MKSFMALAIFTLLMMFDLAADARLLKTQVTVTPGSGTSAGSSSIPGGSGLGSEASRGSSVSGDAGIVRGSSAANDAAMGGSSAGTSVNPTTGVTTFGATTSPSPSGNIDTNAGVRSPAGTGFQTAPRPIGEGQSPFTNPPTPQAGGTTTTSP